MLTLDSVTALIIAPHPDDEVFGCGGLIQRLKSQNSKVYVLYMTVGTTQDFSSNGESSAAERIENIRQVAEHYKLDGYAIALPGNDYHLRLDAVPQKELIHVIERGGDICLQELRPDVVITPANSDYNQDHRAVSDATISAVRPAGQQYKSFQPLVLTYELPYQQWHIADTQTSPALYVRLTDEELEAKVTALQFYNSQLKAPESPLSVHGVRTLAGFRGLQCGSAAAEAFQIRRWVV